MQRDWFMYHLRSTYKNRLEYPFKDIVLTLLRLHLNFFYFDVCVVWWCSDGPINSQEYKSFKIHAVTIKISMTEYHRWINGQAHHLF